MALKPGEAWVEITSAVPHGGAGWELGTCLWSPVTNTSKAARYALMTQPVPGDLVLHLAKGSWIDGAKQRRLVGWSRIASRATIGDQEPPEPGDWAGAGSYYRIELEEFTRTPTAVDVKAFLVSHREHVAYEAAACAAYPFVDQSNGLRAATGLYLRRASTWLVSTLLEAAGAPPWPVAPSNPARSGRAPVVPSRPSRSGRALGQGYRSTPEPQLADDRAKFDVDLSVVERGTRAHWRTQETLAAFLRHIGVAPRSPAPGEPDYDIAWTRDGVPFVAEVKSITSANEEKQLRLGLGQVLRYWHQLAASGLRAVPVLVCEHEPSDVTWRALCADLGVLLTWPGDFGELVLDEWHPR